MGRVGRVWVCRWVVRVRCVCVGGVGTCQFFILNQIQIEFCPGGQGGVGEGKGAREGGVEAGMGWDEYGWVCTEVIFGHDPTPLDRNHHPAKNIVFVTSFDHRRVERPAIHRWKAEGKTFKMVYWWAFN